jgi:undecaprenyl diphosphate synthase
MELVKTHLDKEYNFYKKHNLQITCTGNLKAIPPEVADILQDVVSFTSNHTGTVVNLALNYGGRAEIVRSVNRFLEHNSSSLITSEDITNNLDHPDYPDIDLVIRTANEKRFSNFLIWQSAYAEFYFTHTLWPDFDTKDIDLAIASYQERVRKFGGAAE